MSLLTLPETPTASTTLLRKPDSLRIRMAVGEAERVVKLADGKTTIGSSPQCTIVLPSADSRPLQCVVTVDSHRAEAIRWGAGVQLNRRDFSKSIVAVGDKLTIGRCEIEFATAEELDERAALAEAAAVEATRPAATPAPTKSTRVEQLEPETPQVTEVVSPLPPVLSIASRKLEAPEPSHAESASTPVPTTTALVVFPQQPQPSPVPLASRPTIVIEPASKPVTLAAEPTPPPVTVLAAEQTPIDSYSSHAFADELILQLWQVSDRSRRRAKSLIAATRDARLRTDAMAADLAAMEVELDLARAAYDSHAADHEQLHLELIGRDRRAADLIGPHLAEVETLRSQLQEAQIELAEQAARCDELNATLETQESNSVASANTQAAETARAAELEQSLAVQIEQATLLAHELGAVRTELDGVRRELDQQATRRRELESELTAAQADRDAHKQRADEATDQAATIAQLRVEVESLHDERTQITDKLSDAELELTRLSERCQTANDRVAELEQAIAARVTTAPEATAPELTSLEPTAGDAHDAAVGEPTSPLAIDDVAWNTTPELEPQSVETPSGVSHESILQAWTPAEESGQAACDATVECCPVELQADAIHDDDNAGDSRVPALAPVETVPVASELAPTSFIDKYRHLLDNDAAAAPLTPAAPPQIDDEFLSPAKAADRTVPADDSDEALDAYMASMMQRMRSHSSSEMPELAPIAPAESVDVVPSEPAPLDYDPSVPFEIESMKQGRRAPASTDLAALREIANTSARSAIATHRKKRKVESAIGKVFVALIAFGTAGFLIWNAPSLQDWQFGAGVAVGLIGLGAAALAMRHPDRAIAQPAHFAADESADGDA